MSKSVPNVIVKFKYSLYGDEDVKRRRDFYSSNKKDDYIGYIDKGATDETNHDLIDYEEHVIAPLKEKHPYDYMAYIGKKEKSKGVFSKNGYLSVEDKKAIRSFLRETKSPIWDCVISFQEEYGKEHLFNDKQAQELLNHILPKFFKETKLNPENMLWFAGLHENTDNRHIHLSFAEIEPRWYHDKDRSFHFRKGKFSQKFINQMKVEIENHFDSEIEKQKLEARELFKEVRLELETKTDMDYENGLKILFKPLIDKIPIRGRKSYNSANMRPYKSDIDQLTTYILEHGNNQRLYFDLLHKIDQCDDRIYERCQTHSAQAEDNYIMPKFQQDLYQRIGNVIINKIVEERDKKYQEFQSVKNENYRRKQEIKSIEYLLCQSSKIAQDVDRESLEVFLEYQWKLKEIELEKAKKEYASEIEMV